MRNGTAGITSIIFLAGYSCTTAFVYANIVNIAITDQAFVPRIVDIQAGDQVRWFNLSSDWQRPDSMPHGWDNQATKPRRKPDYPEIERGGQAVAAGDSTTTAPLTRIGWWGYHNHYAGSFWHGLVIVSDPQTGLPNAQQLFSLVPTTPLKPGDSGTQVRKLQTLLSYNSVVYPEGTVSGYYGARTAAAVQRVQERYGLGDFELAVRPRVGVLDTETLNKLHEIFDPSMIFDESISYGHH